ncbi:nucleocapsid protein [Parajeilongvirus brazilense]|nr:nucleocapsid protein [Diaemus bat paramyxovirus]
MSLFETIRDFKLFKNNPPKGGLLHPSLSGLKQKVIVLIPGDQNIDVRWRLLLMSLGLIWSYMAPESVIIGAYLTLLTLFSEQPAQMLKAMTNDPDIEVQVLDVIINDAGDTKFSSRGMNLSDQENAYQVMAESGPDKQADANPFIAESVYTKSIGSAMKFQEAISSVTLQVWVLLSKAVTAPDTARDSEQRRWVKYLQQRRVKADYKLKPKWLDIARDKMAEHISIRRLMVEILIEIGRASGSKSRIVEMIADVGNYIAETGMAGFFLTIKYGLETRYPALALNEFQGDLTTLQQLMLLYKEQGERAPYLVLLEDSVQTKFAPGNYPLIWSYAMGVGTSLDKSMNNLNFNRNYLEPLFFKLGQDTVTKLEGNIDRNIAKELNLDESQIQNLKEVVRPDLSQQAQGGLRARTSHFAVEPIQPDTMAPVPDQPENDSEAYITPYKRVLSLMKNTEPASTTSESAKNIITTLREKLNSKISTTTGPAKGPDVGPNSGNTVTSDDMEVVNNI